MSPFASWWFKLPFHISAVKVHCPSPHFWEFPADSYSRWYSWLWMLLLLISLRDSLSCRVTHTVHILHHIHPNTKRRPSASTGHMLPQAGHSCKAFMSIAEFTKALGQWKWDLHHRDKKFIKPNTAYSTPQKGFKIYHCITPLDTLPHSLSARFSPAPGVYCRAVWLCSLSPATHVLRMPLPPKQLMEYFPNTDPGPSCQGFPP